MTTHSPRDPVAAATHADPYPYYAALVAHRPIYRDERLGLWVASSARAVSAVLASELCLVRPPAEPVPSALLGSPAAEIFRYMVRMNDGERHHPNKQGVTAALRSLEARTILELARRWTRPLLERSRQEMTYPLHKLAFHLPVYVVASLLGVSSAHLPQIAQWMDAFVPALAPGCTPEQLQQGKEAAARLTDRFHTLLAAQQAEHTSSLLTCLATEMIRAGQENPAAISANAIGLMFQAYDATAGLLGNSMVTLARHPTIYAQITASPQLLPLLVAEVLRYDPPVQNTRRFLARSGEVAGQEMQAGEAILLVLAAANRDPALNPQPEHCELRRENRQHFTFGEGLHACPGATLASTIALGGLEQLLACGLQPAAVATTVTYRPAANVRIALFTPHAD